MATSLSDDGSAPVDFNLSSTIDDSESKNSGPKEKCLLCNNLRKTFYCKSCILNGDFVSSNPQNPERFSDKKLLWLTLKNDKALLSSKCVKMFEKMEVNIRLETEINQCRGRIKLLMQLIKKKNEVIKKTNKEIDTVREKNMARVVRLPRNKERVEKLEFYVANNMKTEIKQRKIRVAKAEQELKKIVQKNVEDLLRYIFPIYKIDAISKSGDEFESTDTVSALAEATRTSYVRGKWVFMDSTGDLHYKIVAPTLPGSGDYSAYSDWVAANKNGVPVNEKLNENQAHNISAALCYTTQLVNLLAFYLDVLLPNRLSYVDFYSIDISDSKFYKRVSKLNTNILYLCFSQGVDTSLLNPKHTLCNLLHLVNHSDLGKTEPFEIDSNLFLSLENYGADVKTDDCSEDEENDVVPSEWEAIPLVPCPESTPGSTAFSTQQMPSMQATTSMAGNLESSARKSQDNLEQLLGSQENTFHKVCEVFSPSSLSTNVGDLEDLLLSNAENPNPDESSKPQLSSTYNLRSRAVTKQGRKKGAQSDTANVQNSKRRKNKGRRQYPVTNNVESDDIMESCSQKSVSMLQGLYKVSRNSFSELLETWTDPTPEITTGNSDEKEENVWNVAGSPQEGEVRNTVENCTQTEFPVLLNVQREKEITKHVKFVGCIVKLKAMLSSKDKKENIKENTNLHDVLQNIVKDSCEEGSSMAEASKREAPLSKETIGYILRSTDSESIFCETVQTLLSHLENILKGDFLEAASCWRNSVYEMAVDILNVAADSDPRIRKIVKLFLFRVLKTFSDNKGRTKNLLLEAKAVFIMTFCKSTYLSFILIYYIIGELKLLETKPVVFAKKESRSNFVKNLCLLIRILEVSLESVKSKLQRKEIDKVSKKEDGVKNYNVLEMWKKHWRADETPEKTKAECQWNLTISNWLNELDEVLINCVNHFPITAMAVERCKRLLVEMLKITSEEEKETEGAEAKNLTSGHVSAGSPGIVFVIDNGISNHLGESATP